MKTMLSKFPGTCCDCHKPIARGVPIKYFGRGRGAAHQNCFNPEGKSDSEIAAEVRAPCWICQDPNGRFRQRGAGTPVWCDKCHAEQESKSTTVGNVRFTNCSIEDESCGDAAYEDACARACGL